MALSDKQLDAIILADALRHIAREANVTDTTSRAGIAHGSNDRAYMAGMGLMPANESKRRTPNRIPRLRMSGTMQADGTYHGTSPNVAVYHVGPGTVRYPHTEPAFRVASSFKVKTTEDGHARNVRQARELTVHERLNQSLATIHSDNA